MIVDPSSSYPVITKFAFCLPTLAALISFFKDNPLILVSLISTTDVTGFLPLYEILLSYNIVKKDVFYLSSITVLFLVYIVCVLAFSSFLT